MVFLFAEYIASKFLIQSITNNMFTKKKDLSNKNIDIIKKCN